MRTGCRAPVHEQPDDRHLAEIWITIDKIPASIQVCRAPVQFCCLCLCLGGFTSELSILFLPFQLRTVPLPDIHASVRAFLWLQTATASV